MVTTRLVSNPEDTQPTRGSDFSAGFAKHTGGPAYFDFHLTGHVRNDFKPVTTVIQRDQQ